MTSDLMPLFILCLLMLGVALVMVAALEIQIGALKARIEATEELVYLHGEWLMRLTYDVCGKDIAVSENLVGDERIARHLEAR